MEGELVEAATASIELTRTVYTLLGILFGLIFVLDGWRSATSETVALTKSPKVRGVVLFLGGGTIPLLETISTDDVTALHLYGLSFLITVFVLLIILCGYVAIFSAQRLKEADPALHGERLWIECVKYVISALTDGLPQLHQHLDALRERNLVFERNQSIEYLVAGYGATTAMGMSRAETEGFINQIETYLYQYITKFLDRELGRFRASIYYRTGDSDQLMYLCGIAPETAPHSYDPLPFDGSVAGFALSNPTETHCYASSKQALVPFAPRLGGHRYRAIAACAVQAPDYDDEEQPWMVICIDSTDDHTEAFTDFMLQMLFGVSRLIADTKVQCRVSREAIIEWANA